MDEWFKSNNNEMKPFYLSYFGDRYCSECKTDTSEVIGAGEKMRLTKKKANMVSKRNETGNGRDWGKVSDQCYNNGNHGNDLAITMVTMVMILL